MFVLCRGRGGGHAEWIAGLGVGPRDGREEAMPVAVSTRGIRVFYMDCYPVALVTFLILFYYN